ncbi:hypothetical protein [Mycobacterium haemophilum]|nr:hypothetical protein [Mycobacterium haemophilum]MCV7341584.1 hypothetical protein [Mycobacterium haemophilum DSM 44634]
MLDYVTHALLLHFDSTIEVPTVADGVIADPAPPIPRNWEQFREAR